MQSRHLTDTEDDTDGVLRPYDGHRDADPPRPVMPAAPPFRSFDPQPTFPHQPTADER